MCVQCKCNPRKAQRHKIKLPSAQKADFLSGLPSGVRLKCSYFMRSPVAERRRDPTEAGFFCGDESISKPYKGSTVSSTWLFSVGFTVPAIIILVAELGGKTEWNWRVQPRSLPAVLLATLRTYVFFLFTTFAVALITNVAKTTLGRLRPNFLDVCRPNYEEINCTTTDGFPIYITDYECLGNPEFGDDAAMASALRDARMSFMSGHATFAFQSMMFGVLYLQAMIHPLCRKTFLVPFLQLAFFAMAFGTTLTRLTDNKHHPADLLVGAVIGMAMQWFNVVYIMRLFVRRRSGDNSADLPVTVKSSGIGD